MSTPEHAQRATFADYVAVDALNWSTLKHLQTSPKLLRYREDHAEGDKPAFQVGRATHTAVLEPDRWAIDYTAQPKFPDLRTKAGKAAKAAWLADQRPGAEALPEATYDLCETIAAAVRSHKRAAELLSVGRPEVTVEWANGVACKARLDWLRPDGLVDFKTTRARNLREFTADCARYLYHGQVAWYEAGAKAAGLLNHAAEMPYIIAAQTVEPYDVWVIRVAGLAIAAGRSMCDGLLAKYMTCKQDDHWPGIAPDEVDLDLPAWAPGVAIDEDQESPITIGGESAF